jgi:hypothetical protein
MRAIMLRQTTRRARFFRHAGPVRPRSANEWRSFWHHGGDAELREVMRSEWPPLQAASEAEAARPAERIATLLGSNAPVRALASELGRIRADELGSEPDPEADRSAAEAIQGWFASRSLVAFEADANS